MKPLAILRDSLREAWDSKILLVMLVLSAIFLALVASIGYSPASPDAVLQAYRNDLSNGIVYANRGKIFFPSQSLAGYQVTDVETVRAASNPADGEYRFTVVVTQAVPDGFEKQVAAWHEDGSGTYAQLTNRGMMQPGEVALGETKMTDEMVRAYFSGTLDLYRQLPLTDFARLPDPGPNSRAYQITAGPSAEPKEWPVSYSIMFGAWDSGKSVRPLGQILYQIQDTVINTVAGMMIIMLGVIVTSFFIPNMLRKGGIDLMLAKPINRVTLLLFKFLGGTFFVLILASVVVGGVWVITGVRAGVWTPHFLLVIPLLTFAFAMLYSLSALMAVLTRSSITCILVTLAFAGLLWVVGKVMFFADLTRLGTELQAEMTHTVAEIPTWVKVTEGLNGSLPRWHDIDVLSGKIVADSLMSEKQRNGDQDLFKRKYPSWGGTIGVTLAWIGLVLGLACWRFSVKDY